MLFLALICWCLSQVASCRSVSYTHLRESIQRIKSSGLENLLQECTFDTYQIDEEWQRRIKQDAMEFVEDHDRKWFFIGGQVGAGKTHICTAIVGAFLDRGYRCKYMLWRDEAVKLKAVANDDFEYSKAVSYTHLLFRSSNYICFVIGAKLQKARKININKSFMKPRIYSSVFLFCSIPSTSLCIAAFSSLFKSQ